MKLNKSESAKRMVWAIYVLGYDVRHFWNWHQSVWSCRELASHGQARFKSSILDLAGDVFRAMDIASVGLLPKSAMRLGQWMTEWKSQAKQLLRDLDPKRYLDSDIDWDQQSPPGLELLWDAGESLRAALKDRPHLERWHAVGLTLSSAAYGDWGVDTATAADLRDQLTVLQGEGTYAFLASPIAFLDRIASGQRIANKPGPFVDADLPVPRLQRIDDHLRRELSRGVEPEPAVVVNAKGITFFGVPIACDQFHPAEWAILVRLCRQPYHLISTPDLVQAGQLSGKNPKVAPHITRIRDVLRLMKPDLGTQRFTPEGRKAFIVAHKFEGRPPKYVLEIDASLVRVDEGVDCSQ